MFILYVIVFISLVCSVSSIYTQLTGKTNWVDLFNNLNVGNINNWIVYFKDRVYINTIFSGFFIYMYSFENALESACRNP